MIVVSGDPPPWMTSGCVTTAAAIALTGMEGPVSYDVGVAVGVFTSYVVYYSAAHA